MINVLHHKKGKPAYVAKNGNVKVPVYFRLDKGKYPSYRVKLKRDSEWDYEPFSNYDDAVRFADQTAEALSLGTMVPDVLKPSEVSDYRRLKMLEKSLDGVPLWEFLIKDAIPAYLMLKESGFKSLIKAAEAYARNFKDKPIGVTVAQAIQMLLAYKADKSPCYVSALRRATRELLPSYGALDIRDLTIGHVTGVLLKVTGRSFDPTQASLPTVKPSKKKGAPSARRQNR